MGKRKRERTFKWRTENLRHLDIILCAGVGPLAFWVRANTVSVEEAFNKGIITHIAIVYQLRTGKMMLVEARGGKGVQMRPLTDYDNHNRFRFAAGVRRLNLSQADILWANSLIDTALSNGAEYDARGATSFNNLVRNIRVRRGKRLQMEKDFYCSELAREALINALPERLREGLINPESFRDVGIKVRDFRWY